MAPCEHLIHAEEQMRELLCVINDHLKLYDPDEDTYSSLLSVAYHMNEGLRELGYLLDQAEENGSSGVVKEVGPLVRTYQKNPLTLCSLQQSNCTNSSAF